MSHAFENYLKSKGIERQTSAPYAHQQNGRAECCYDPLIFLLFYIFKPVKSDGKITRYWDFTQNPSNQETIR